MNTQGQLAVVTGASTGIGLELARLCAQQRYDLIIAADKPLVENAARELRRGTAAPGTGQTKEPKSKRERTDRPHV
jgi:NAD(P)-dependent dehydrogenase (short-subunit alcohol dehydrogenase family)